MSDEKKEKDLKPIAKGHVKEKSGLEKFLSAFSSEDIRYVIDYIVHDELIPGIRDTAVDFVVSGIEMFFYGSSSGRRRGLRSRRGGETHYSYGSYFERNNSYSRDRVDRGYRSDRYDFSTIEFDSRGEAESVIFAMEECLDHYDGVATVADL